MQYKQKQLFSSIFIKEFFPFKNFPSPFLWPPSNFVSLSLYPILGSHIYVSCNYVSWENLLNCTEFTCLKFFIVYQVRYRACLWSFRCGWRCGHAITHSCGGQRNNQQRFTESSLQPSILCKVVWEKSWNQA